VSTRHPTGTGGSGGDPGLARAAGPIELPPGPHTTRLATAPAEVPEAFVTALVAELGAPGVLSGEDTLAAFSRDWWPLAAVWARRGEVPARPAVVARPETGEEVAACLRLAHEHRVPATAAAGRSGVCGGAVPLAGGVVLDLTAMAGLVDLDDTSLLCRVAPGTWGDDFASALANRGMTLGHWPQSVAVSTVGGWLACRSAGQYSTRYGKIEDMVAGLEVVDGRGRRIRTGGAPRAATGPDLTQVFVGSEGTLGVITEATLRVRPTPSASAWAAYGFTAFADGLDACRRVLRRGGTPAVLRLYDAVEARRNFSQDGHLLLVLDEGDPGHVDWNLAVVEEECRRTPGVDERDRRLVGRWLEHRNDVSALGVAVGAGLVVDTVEVAATWATLPGLYQAVVEGISAVPGTLAASGHCSHAYLDGGCLYFTFAGQAGDDPAAQDGYYRSALGAAMTATVASGGAISHHHGVGLARGPWMRPALGEGAFETLVGLKQVLDPAGILNPGKLGLPSPFLPEGWDWG
jgi:alkyldihydroxyacetonephosphate synthase